MNIVVCASQVPFVRGGAEVLVDGLIAALRTAGHKVEQVALPFKWYPRTTLEQQALLWRNLDLQEVAGRQVDAVICTKFPTWAVKHPCKIVWLVHQHRQAYDWYGTPLSDFGTNEADRQARRLVIETDALGLGEARKIYTISQNVANRLVKYNHLAGTALYPPTEHDLFHHASYGDYIFTVSRLDSAKRLDLLLESLKRCKTPVKAVIAGSGPESERLKQKAAKLGLGGRVSFPGRVDETAKINLYANALAVYYAPVDEDYGYVTVEGMRSRKAVITAPDSGGVLEFVRDGVNGFVCPDPAQFAAAFDKLYTDRTLAAQLGEAGLETARLVPTWPEIAQTILDC